MNHGPTGTAAVFAIAAGMLLSPFAANGAAQTPAEQVNPTLELASPFVDNAILQRQMPVPVWGWSRPGSKVAVVFAGQTKSATADKGGKWMVRLDPLEASSDERELTVTASSGETLTCKGVLVGEVWFASGQSNMEWGAGKSMCRDLAGMLQRSREEHPVQSPTQGTTSAAVLNERRAWSCQRSSQIIPNRLQS
ncbi:MAG: hypothetical protein ACYTG0_02660 [Planctomycetota bacterium]|jgi:hypothetical protein